MAVRSMFAASASVSGDDEIGVTGDHTQEIAEVMLSKFKEVRARAVPRRGRVCQKPSLVRGPRTELTPLCVPPCRPAQITSKSMIVMKLK